MESLIAIFHTLYETVFTSAERATAMLRQSSRRTLRQHRRRKAR